MITKPQALKSKDWIFFLLLLLSLVFIGSSIGQENQTAIMLFVGFAAFLFFLFALSKPYSAFIILIFFASTESFSNIQVVSNVSLMVALGSFIVLVWIIQLANHRMKLVFIKEFKPLLLLGVIAIISSLINREQMGSLRSLFTYLQQLLLVVLIVNFATTPKKLHVLGTVMIFSSLVIAFLMVINKINLIPQSIIGFQVSNTDQEFQARSMGFFNDPNYTGAQLIIALPFIVERFISIRWHFQRFLLIMAAGMIILAFSFTLSISSLVGLLAYIVLKTMVLGKHNIIARAGLGFLILIVGFFASNLLFPETFFDKIEQNLVTLSDYVSGENTETFSTFGSNRGTAWEAAIKAIKKSPLIGYGPGNGKYANARYNPASPDASAAHNTILGIASDLGLIGLVFFAYLFIAAWLSRVPKQMGKKLIGSVLFETNTAIFLALTMCLVLSLGLDMNILKFPFILIGMSFALKRISKKSSSMSVN